MMVLCQNYLFGQTVWSLARCIQHAQTNNLQINQNKLSQELANEKIAYTKKDLYPTLQFSLSPTMAMGRSLDPTTYQYATNGFLNNVMSLTMSQIVSAGGRKKNTYEQSIVEQELAKLQEKKGVSAIAIQITQAYFQVLLNKIYVKNSERQLNVSKEQLEVVNQAAKKSKDLAYNLLEWQAQVVNDEFLVTKNKNELKAAQIGLGTLLALPDPLFIDVEEMKEEYAEIQLNAKGEYDLFYKLTSWHPNTKIMHLNQKLASLQFDAVKASSLPTISLTAGVSLPYSSLFKEVDRARLVRNDTVPIFSGGQLRLALAPTYDYTYKTTSLFSQWQQLASSYIGFQISIPLVTGGLHKYQMKQAYFTVATSQIAMQTARTELYKEAVFTQSNLEAALLQKQAANKNLEVWQKYYDSSMARYQKGEIQAKEFETIKNNFFQVEQNAIVAKYDLMMKKKLYKYYATGDLAVLN
jgi:outer membrane protein